MHSCYPIIVRDVRIKEETDELLRIVCVDCILEDLISKIQNVDTQAYMDVLKEGLDDRQKIEWHDFVCAYAGRQPTLRQTLLFAAAIKAAIYNIGLEQFIVDELLCDCQGSA